MFLFVLITVFSKLLAIFSALYGGQTANSGAGNMNGKYLVASGGRQAVPYNDDYASKNYKYFDVWSPEIATHYGEVFWTDQGNNPIPQEISDTFKGKVMAIVGYEMDQVMVTPVGKPGVNPDKDVSVPINWAYNHHYMAWLTGAHSKLVKMANPNLMDVSAHGYHMRWEAVPKEAPFERVSPEIPISQWFSEGNGGESRKSYHGYPTGYAQLIDSPDMWHITPMQIDTRNRDCGATPDDIHKCTTFTPGPEPKQARYGLGIPEKPMYSGLLECPCNSRFGGDPHIYGPDTKTKSIKHHFTLVAQSTCGKSAINSADDCFFSAAHIGIIASKNVTLSAASDKVPKGCSVMIDSDGTTTVTYNKFNSLAACSSSTNRGGSTSFNSIKVTLSLQLTSTMVTITITGPAGAWFGVGFNATHMADSPYAIITNSTGVYERQIGTCGSEGEHCPGDALPSTLTVVSNKVENNMRTVVLTRGLKGKTSKYYTFDVTKQSQINMIAAVGVSEEFAYHKAHDTSTIILMAQGEANCICDIGMEGVLCYNNGSNCNSFVKNCVPAPDGELLTQKNPTCNSLQYAGGLSCCGHRRIMLDADQEIRPELLRYHMKFRFWYQEYTNNTGKVSHYNLERIYYQTEAWAGEYDIPPAFAKPGKPIPGYPDWPVNTPTPGTTCTGNCPDGDDCECEHMIVFKWELSNTRLIYAGGHCHAPSCISMKLYRNDTGHEMELLCEQVPVIGKGNVHHDKYDEAGYIALPPCLWGDDEGLDPAVLLPPKTPMVSIKRNRNTHMGHFGEMASWQMRGVNF